MDLPIYSDFHIYCRILTCTLNIFAIVRMILSHSWQVKGFLKHLHIRMSSYAWCFNLTEFFSNIVPLSHIFFECIFGVQQNNRSANENRLIAAVNEKRNDRNKCDAANTISWHYVKLMYSRMDFRCSPKIIMAKMSIKCLLGENQNRLIYAMSWSKTNRTRKMYAWVLLRRGLSMWICEISFCHFWQVLNFWYSKWIFFRKSVWHETYVTPNKHTPLHILNDI